METFLALLITTVVLAVIIINILIIGIVALYRRSVFTLLVTITIIEHTFIGKEESPRVQRFQILRNSPEWNHFSIFIVKICTFSKLFSQFTATKIIFRSVFIWISLL